VTSTPLGGDRGGGPATPARKEPEMTVNEALRALAGFMILLSLALGIWVHPYWFVLTAFVGLNLLQSAFTRWCPAMAIFRKLGLREG